MQIESEREEEDTSVDITFGASAGQSCETSNKFFKFVLLIYFSYKI